MILLDWTRMGKVYCLAGAVIQRGEVRIVRPLLGKYRAALVRNVGWSPWLLDGHTRWEVFEFVGPEAAAPEPPHLEDLWVRDMRPRKATASRTQRIEILRATTPALGEALFGTPLLGENRPASTAYVLPGTGSRSLVTVILSQDDISINAFQLDGTAEPDVYATLRIQGVLMRRMKVKDHHLLLKAEQGAKSVSDLGDRVRSAIRAMGDQVAVRLGLAREFQKSPEDQARCYLMADGFFSFTDPQS
jgi:hypothetical protein